MESESDEYILKLKEIFPGYDDLFQELRYEITNQEWIDLCSKIDVMQALKSDLIKQKQSLEFLKNKRRLLEKGRNRLIERDLVIARLRQLLAWEDPNNG